ncbi:uncharacterized protein [Epargyreus clarus]|uniref:uncharacterized protein isoform X2 n=1 Tax=Epargyreus clarus TaxID=520877 RepID=UPI003C2E84AD
MKFLSVSVLVLFAYVPVAYSNNAGAYSWRPTNIQNAYQLNGPVLQPANIPVSNPALRSNEINRNQPSPNQYVNQIGPRPSYQIPQNVPITQNNVQPTNLQSNARASTLPLPASPLQYSPPNLNLKAIYEASKPTKQYTIVHLNGTVEHTNDLQAIAARHPNFVMLKAADVLANKYIPVKNIGIPQKIPPAQTAPIPVQTPAPVTPQAIATNQNGWTTNSYRGAYNNQQPIPNLRAASLASNSNSIYQSVPNVKYQQPAVGATLAPISATPTSQQPVPLTNQQIQRNPTNVYLGGSNSQSTIQNSNGPVVTGIPNTAAQTVPPIPNDTWKLLAQINVLPPNQQQSGNLQNPINQITYNQVGQPVVSDVHKDAVAANPSAFYPPKDQQNSPSVPSSVSYASTNISPPSTRNLPENAIAANPLPIYPQSYVPNAAIKSSVPNEPSAIGAAAAQTVAAPVQPPLLPLPNNNQSIFLNPQIIKDKQDAINALNSNISIPYTDAQNQSSSINLPASSNPLPQTLFNVIEPQTLPVLLPKEPQQNSSQEKPPTIIQELPKVEDTQDKNAVNGTNPPYNVISIQNKTADPITKIITSVKATVLDPSGKEIVGSSTTNPPNVTDTDTQAIDKNNVPSNNTKPAEIIKDNTVPKIDNSTKIPSVSNETATLPTIDHGLSWFALNDNHIWDLVRNSTQNVFFFFMPPRPKVTKESKTVIFANGTTVEETTETVMDVGPDGEPKVTVTTTKSYN